MSPGGHLVVTALACGAVHTLTGSAALTAGVAAGGLLIDVDHVFDYVIFEGQRDLRPAAFLSYYTEQRARRVALLLHSYELLALLAALAWATNSVPLWGYLLGAGLHLPLDIVFNGRVLARNLVPFYSLAYRWRRGFDATPLPTVGRLIFEEIVAVASGKRTKSELSGVGEEEFAPWIIGPVM